MSVRVKRYSTDGIGEASFENLGGSSVTQRETTVDGQTFHWGPNEVRNFLDENVGRRHAAFNPGTNITLDPIPFGTATS